MSLNLRFAVSFIDLIITIQYAVFCKSLSTSYVSLYIYIHRYNNGLFEAVSMEHK